jgi:hypothetical protein
MGAAPAAHPHPTTRPIAPFTAQLPFPAGDVYPTTLGHLSAQSPRLADYRTTTRGCHKEGPLILKLAIGV